MPDSPEMKRDKRVVRKAAGVCISCGQNPAIDGRVKCKKCLIVHISGSYAKRRLRAFDILGRVCEVCGETDVRAFHIDHRYGDGAEHRARLVGGSRSGSIGLTVAVMQEVITHPRAARCKYQLLCANCHARKHSYFRYIEGDVWRLLA